MLVIVGLKFFHIWVNGPYYRVSHSWLGIPSPLTLWFFWNSPLGGPYHLNMNLHWKMNTSSPTLQPFRERKKITFAINTCFSLIKNNWLASISHSITSHVEYLKFHRKVKLLENCSALTLRCKCMLRKGTVHTVLTIYYFFIGSPTPMYWLKSTSPTPPTKSTLPSPHQPYRIFKGPSYACFSCGKPCKMTEFKLKSLK